MFLFKVLNREFRSHSGVQRSGWETACCHRLARRIAPDVEDLLDVHAQKQQKVRAGPGGCDGFGDSGAYT